MHPIVIIGGGPAGSLAAIVLARRGHRIRLIEQHTFPRDKVCGECLSSVGLDVLRRQGLEDLLWTAGGVRLTRAVIHAIDAEPIETPLPAAMCGLTRRALDALLLNVSIDAGVAVQQPARCEKVEPGSTAIVTIRDLRTNALESISAEFVLVADGKGAMPDRVPAASGDLGIKAHFRGIAGPRDAIELFGGVGQYGGLAPVEDDWWNVAFAVPAARVRACGGDLDAWFAEALEQSPPLKRRLRGAKRAGPWLASPLPRFAVRQEWLANVIPIGNAAAALEPIGGEGMGLALRSAELAADAVHAAVSGKRPVDTPALRRRYQQLWQTRRAACRGLAMVSSRPTLASLASSIGGWQAFRTAGLAMMGKSSSADGE